MKQGDLVKCLIMEKIYGPGPFQVTAVYQGPCCCNCFVTADPHQCLRLRLRHRTIIVPSTVVSFTGKNIPLSPEDNGL